MNDQQIFELADRLKAAKEMKRELEDKVKEVNEKSNPPAMLGRMK